MNLTYALLRVWDERRIIVPTPRLLDEPFENWTKVSPQLHGTVYVYVDYGLPVEDLRAELERAVHDHPLWDGRTCSVLVTGTDNQTVELRALVSARTANDVWNLRCAVREKLVSWLRTYEDGRFRPRARVELDNQANAVT